MNFNCRSFLTGLMTAIPLLSTIKFGSTEIVELVPKTDKSRELIVRTTDVKNKWNGNIHSKEYIQSWNSLLKHIDNEFDPSTATKQEVDDIFSGKVSIFSDDTLSNYSEGTHPIAAVRELLNKNRVIVDFGEVEWVTFIDKWAPTILL